MRTFVVALTIAALTLPASVQAGGRKHRGSDQTTERKPKVDDKAYARALSSLPNQKYDPWKDMR